MSGVLKIPQAACTDITSQGCFAGGPTDDGALPKCQDGMRAATDEGAWPSGSQQQLCGGNVAHETPYSCNSMFADTTLELFEQLLSELFISESTGLTMSRTAHRQLAFSEKGKIQESALSSVAVLASPQGVDDRTIVLAIGRNVLF